MFGFDALAQGFHVSAYSNKRLVIVRRLLQIDEFPTLFEMRKKRLARAMSPMFRQGT